MQINKVVLFIVNYLCDLDIVILSMRLVLKLKKKNKLYINNQKICKQIKL